MSAAQTRTAAVAPSELERAVQEQRAGRAHVAAAIYREILAENSRHHGAWCGLGVLELLQDRLDEGIRSLETAAQLAPENAAYHSNLGLAYHRLGTLEQAERALLRALQLDPELFEATDSLARLLEEKGESELALALFRRAADLRPDVLRVQLSLADALLRAGEHEAAVGHFQCALALEPKSREACLGLATVLQHLRRFSGACALAQRVIAEDSGAVAAHVRLGSALAEQFRFDEARLSLERALALDPDSFEAGDWLGYCLRNLGRVPEALAVYRRALEAARRRPPRGSVQGGLEGDSPARAVAGGALALLHSSLVYMSAFDPASRPEQVLAEAKAWSEEHALPLQSRRRPHPHDPTPERKLRVAYVSPDFREHCQSFFLVPVFSHHDRQRFEIHCYSSVLHADERTRWFRTHADVWSDVAGLSDAALARRIRDDQVDILVDLTMHMANGRLLAFAERPAPVQISWLAYPGTTGLEAIDYRLTDAWLDPPGGPLPYAERSLHLPDAFWCYDPLTREPAVNPLPALQTGRLTLGSFNDFCKVHAGVIEIWASVLCVLPAARFLLLAPSGSARAAVLDAFEANGVERERIGFVDRAPRLKYLEYYQRVDLALDCFPANGHTTSLDALWMGVPVVTLVGNGALGRAGLCQCQQLGLQDWVAHTPEQFVQIAVRASRNLQQLDSLRQELRSRLEASPLMDGPRFTRGLESAYRLAWRRWCGATA